MWLNILFSTSPHELWAYKSKSTLLCVAILSGQISKVFICILLKKIGLCNKNMYQVKWKNVMVWYQNPRMAHDGEGQANFQSRNL